MGEMRDVHKVLVGKPERKRLLGIPRRIREDNIRMDLSKMGLEGCGLDSCRSRQSLVAGFCEHGDAPSGSIKDGKFLD
jgi:hypothetical protein